MRKEFEVTGKITIHVSLDVEAETEDEAVHKAQEQFEDYFHLNTSNHMNEGVDINLDAIEIEYEDDDTNNT